MTAIQQRIERVLRALEAIAPLQPKQREALERDLALDEQALRGMEILLGN